MSFDNIKLHCSFLIFLFTVNMDFLATIAPPVVSQPQAFTDAMLDPTSRGLITSLSTKHMSGATLQRTLRHSADHLQRNVQGQFVSLKVSI